MKTLNTIRSYPAGYDPPPLPQGLCKHSVLADMLSHYREFVNPAFVPPVSEKAIRQLIELTFFASMTLEERRFPNFRISCQKDVVSMFYVTRFDPVVLDGVDTLRRLAPILTHPEFALLVTERDGRLWCDGLLNVGPRGYDMLPGRPEFGSVGVPPSIRIEVREPGHVLAGIGAVVYEIRAGKVRLIGSYLAVPSVKTFREQLSLYLECELVQKEGEDATRLFGGSKHSVPIHIVLSRMLRVAVENRHGGTFVITPSDSCDTAPYNIDLKYAARSCDLGLDMIAFWSACANAQRSNLIENHTQAIRRWNTCKAKLLADAEAVGNLSFVDGCVVLTRHLQLCGFGGEIQVSDKQASEAPRVFKDYLTNEQWEYDSFIKEIGGTRHKSAARLCKAHGGMLVFIVSQDGDLKAFSSDATKVNAFGPLDLPSVGINLHP